MVIRFCPKCDGLLMLKKDGAICHTCGHSVHHKLDVSSHEKIPEEEEVGKGSVEDKNVYATYNHECPKCGFDKAQVIDCGVFYSDEDNLIFLKCGKCGYSERVGDKAF